MIPYVPHWEVTADVFFSLCHRASAPTDTPDKGEPRTFFSFFSRLRSFLARFSSLRRFSRFRRRRSASESDPESEEEEDEKDAERERRRRSSARRGERERDLFPVSRGFRAGLGEDEDVPISSGCPFIVAESIAFRLPRLSSTASPSIVVVSPIPRPFLSRCAVA
jgi:hypothetical protein